jgi:lambda repressor-like predicted transcriptional regulator
MRRSYAEKVRQRAVSLPGRQAAMKLAVSEDLWAALERTGISQAELARRAGVSPQYITKVLKGTTNFTLESIVALFYQMGYEMEFGIRPQLTIAGKICQYSPKVLAPSADPRTGYRPCSSSHLVVEGADGPAIAA